MNTNGAKYNNEYVSVPFGTLGPLQLEANKIKAFSPAACKQAPKTLSQPCARGVALCAGGVHLEPGRVQLVPGTLCRDLVRPGWF